jgi:hypothetical protein
MGANEHPSTLPNTHRGGALWECGSLLPLSWSMRAPANLLALCEHWDTANELGRSKLRLRSPEGTTVSNPGWSGAFAAEPGVG